MSVPVRHQMQPDETVLSWLARWCAIGGFYDEKSMYSELFGKERIRFHPYLPCYVENIGDITGSNSDFVLRNNTLFPLFTYFGCAPSQRLSLAMRYPSNGNPLTIAGISHTKIGFCYGHKFCPLCIEEDRTQKGYGYFKIQHQIPGVEVCDTHGCFLHVLEGGDFGFNRKLPLPPTNIKAISGPEIKMKFAKFCTGVLKQSKESIIAVDYQNIYKKELQNKSLLTKCSQLRLKLILQALETVYENFAFGTLLGIPKTLQDFSFVAPLLRKKTHFPCHPTKHLIFGFWLFDGKANVLETPLKIERERIKATQKNKVIGSFQNKVLLLLKKGYSMAHISRKIGKSRNYIRRIAELNMIKHQTKSYAFPTSIRYAVQIQALLGRHRSDIAKSLNVGVGYVEQVISNTIGLSLWRKKLEVHKKIARAMKELTMARLMHPSWHRKEFKEHHNQAFFYLYRQDKESLESILPTPLTPAKKRNNWEKEDERLYLAVSALTNTESLSLSKIGYLVRDRSHLRRNLDKLPQTKELLIKLKKVNRP